ncbi:MAG: riboflavin biosynthesis protein RibF [Bacteroidales bacterium]|nr:riboflavin biosynthesis protein RibF [Bacteroidales bacterium]
MRIFTDLDEVGSIRNPVVTTGSFDGVHIGHKTIINRINNLAKRIDGESVLITFHPHPRKVLYPETAGKDLRLIATQREKIQLLEKTGLDNLIIIKFTKEFAQISSIDFIRNILVGKLHAKKVVIGFNHHFGHNREGNFEYLYELGKYYNFEVEEIPEQDIHNESVSSTKIRKALKEGKIQRANAYLDHHYIMKGRLCRGAEMCRNLNFPTYRLPVEEDVKLVPPDGVYAVSVKFNAETFKAMLNIKHAEGESRESADDIWIELYVLAMDGDLNGRDCTVYFQKRIRNEKEFTDLKALQKQLLNDREAIDELIY